MATYSVRIKIDKTYTVKALSAFAAENDAADMAREEMEIQVYPLADAKFCFIHHNREGVFPPVQNGTEIIIAANEKEALEKYLHVYYNNQGEVVKSLKHDRFFILLFNGGRVYAELY